jgi:membrane-bound serine protease (ClpP class)
MNALDPLVWSILLMLVGCVVLVLEVFIPSGGVLAVISAAAFIGSIVIAFQRGPVTGFTFVMSTVVAVPLVLMLAFHYWPKTKIGKAFLGELPRDEDVLPDDPHRVLIGRVGVARSKMLPSGAVEIDGQMIDALSQGQAIEPGQYVVVTEVRANRVVVRPAKENERPGRPANPSDMLSRSIEELGIESLEDPLA